MRSLDHHVRAQQDRLRNRKAKRLRGLKINDELEGRGLLDQEIAGFELLRILST